MNGKKPGTVFFHKYLAVAAVSSLVLITAIGVTAHIIIQRSIISEAEHHAEEIAEGMSVCELSEIMANSHQYGRLVVDDEKIESLDKELSEFLQPFNILKIKIFDHEGTVVFCSDPEVIGSAAYSSPGLTQALAGQPASKFEAHATMADLQGHMHNNLAIVETYVPLRTPDRTTIGAFEIYTNVQDHLAAGRQTLQTLVFSLSLLVLAVFLVLSVLVKRLCNRLDEVAHQEVTSKADLVRSQQEISTANLELQSTNDRLVTAESEAKARAHDAIQADSAKTTFLANMSHEMRTPLTAILGYTDLIADPETTQAVAANNLAVIRRNGAHLLSLIEDVLDLATIEEGRMSLRITACDTLSFVDDIQTMARLKAIEQSLDFQVKFRTSVPELIFVDATRLKQALLNLLCNAVKFTHEGSVNLEVEYEEKTPAGASVMRFHVIDTGIGINAEIMPELFQPFQQGDNQSNREYGGSGLGLVITQQIAEVLGGDVTVTSEPGKGTHFVLTIAAGDVANQPLVRPELVGQAQPKKSNKPTIDLSGLEILYAEDGLDNQFLVKAILRKAGANVDIAGNGAIAVEKATAKNYDMILMDIQMPVMDGLEATRLILEQGYTRSIVALTANAMANDRRLSTEAGCTEHLTKPINRQMLLETIRDHCRDLVRCEPCL